MYRILGIMVPLLVFSSPFVYGVDETTQVTTCVETSRNPSINLTEIQGSWNVIEVIDNNPDNNAQVSSQSHEFCPTISFTFTSEQQLQMLWANEDGTLQFDYNITNMTTPWLWISNEPKTGKYQPSSLGTTQVMKAAQSYMVFTLCHSEEPQYSVVIVRPNELLSDEELQNVHNLLQRENLALMSIQSYCKNSALSIVSSLSFVFLAMVVSCSRWVS